MFDPLQTKVYLIVAGMSYFLGSIPFGYLLVRLFLKKDIRETGSGNIGATNVARSGAKGLAITTLALDAGKGALAVIMAQMLSVRVGQLYEPFAFPIQKVCAISAFFAIVGHMFPVWLKFKGGKGVATGVGALGVLAPKAIVIVIAIFVAVLVILRYVSLGSILAAAIFPFAAYALDPALRAPAITVAVSAGCALIVAKHHENIRRLMSGTESRFGAKKV